MWNTRLRPMSRSDETSLSEPTTRVPQTRVRMEDADASAKLAAGILDHLVAYAPRPTSLTVVCIGSDRSTGDALGPLVGTRLSQSLLPTEVTVLGSLESPVHAANLSDYMERIARTGGDRRLVVAVDACLGRSENVGTACVKTGPLKPGTGVNKNLPSVGQFHIVGVVNVGGFMEYFVLQNTRLNLVVRLADVISGGIALALDHYYAGKSLPHVAATFEN